ncbi:MAG: HNH endonuclease [Cyanobacteria bacterium P01_F01_bin.150]
MNVHYQTVAQRANHQFEYCKAPELVFNFPFEVEHIVPICLSGSDDVSNLALACRSCNLFSLRLECIHIKNDTSYKPLPIKINGAQ